MSTRDYDLLAPLLAAIAQAERLNLSLAQLHKRARLPVNLATIYRWLSDEKEPGLFRFWRVVRAIEAFNLAERARIAQAVQSAPPPEGLA